MHNTRMRSRDARFIPFVPTSGGFEEPSRVTHDAPPPKRTPLTAEQQVLAESYVPMARSLAKPLKTSWPLESEEFDSAAMLALVEAAQSYDPARNVKFATFARFRIFGALRDVQRGLVTSGYHGDLQNAPNVTTLTLESELHGRVLNSSPDPPIGEELESTDFVESWLRKLPPKHAAACREIYLNGRTQGEAAELVGCSKSRISNIHSEALALLNDPVAYRDYLEPKIKNLAQHESAASSSACTVPYAGKH